MQKFEDKIDDKIKALESNKKLLQQQITALADHNRSENIKDVSGTNKITKDHHENCLHVNRMTST